MYTVDATARKAGDAISDTISARLRSWLENFNRHRSQDDRAVTSEIIVNVDPQIILITTGQHTEQQTDIGIQSLTKHLELWESLLHKADSITFVRESKNEEWIFLHMTTSDGSAINSVGTGPPSNVAVTEGLVDRYDTNNNGTIEKNEVIAAINDYLFGEGDQAISKAEVIKLINDYLFG